MANTEQLEKLDLIGTVFTSKADFYYLSVKSNSSFHIHHVKTIVTVL